MMDKQIMEPTERLAKEIVRVMYIESTIWFVIQIIVMGVLFYLDYYFAWQSWITIILVIIAILLIISKVIDYILPVYRYRNWRFGADEAYLYIKHGAIFETRQIVPMTKIQSVQTDQGPLLRRYHLYAVTVATMGTTHTIPGLKKADAFAVRDEIARYAKIKEEEE